MSLTLFQPQHMKCRMRAFCVQNFLLVLFSVSAITHSAFAHKHSHDQPHGHRRDHHDHHQTPHHNHDHHTHDHHAHGQQPQAPHHHHDPIWTQDADSVESVRHRARQHWATLTGLIEDARRAGVSEAQIERAFDFDGKEILNLPRSAITQIILASLEHALAEAELELITRQPQILGLSHVENRSVWQRMRNSFHTLRQLAVGLTREALHPIKNGINHPTQLSRHLAAQWSFLSGNYGPMPASLGALVGGGTYVISEVAESLVNPFHGACFWNGYLSAALGLSVMGVFRTTGYLMTYDRELGLVDRARLGYTMLQTHITLRRMFSRIVLKQTSALGLPNLTRVLRKQTLNSGLEYATHHNRAELEALIRNSVLWAEYAASTQLKQASASAADANPQQTRRLFEEDVRLVLQDNTGLTSRLAKVAELSAGFEALFLLARQDLSHSHLLRDPRQLERLRLLGEFEKGFARFQFFLQASMLTNKVATFDPAWLESVLDYKLGLTLSLRSGEATETLKLKFKHWNDVIKTSHRAARMIAVYPTSTSRVAENLFVIQASGSALSCHKVHLVPVAFY